MRFPTFAVMVVEHLTVAAAFYMALHKTNNTTAFRNIQEFCGFIENNPQNILIIKHLHTKRKIFIEILLSFQSRKTPSICTMDRWSYLVFQDLHFTELCGLLCIPLCRLTEHGSGANRMALNVVWYAEFYVGRWTRAVCQHHLQKRAVISSPSTHAQADYA